MDLAEAVERGRARRDQVPLPRPRVARAIRLGAGISQADLAAVVEVARPSVARWELGTREPQGETRKRYAEALRQLAAGLAEEQASV